MKRVAYSETYLENILGSPQRGPKRGLDMAITPPKLTSTPGRRAKGRGVRGTSASSVWCAGQFWYPSRQGGQGGMIATSASFWAYLVQSLLIYLDPYTISETYQWK